MKVFTGLALLTPALAGDYGLFRSNADAVQYTLLDLKDSNGATTMKWSIDVQSVFELDTGYEFISI